MPLPAPSCDHVPLPSNCDHVPLPLLCPSHSPTPQEERRRAEVEEEKLRSLREEARVKVGVAEPVI